MAPNLRSKVPQLDFMYFVRFYLFDLIDFDIIIVVLSSAQPFAPLH